MRAARFRSHLSATPAWHTLLLLALGSRTVRTGAVAEGVPGAGSDSATVADAECPPPHQILGGHRTPTSLHSAAAIQADLAPVSTEAVLAPGPGSSSSPRSHRTAYRSAHRTAQGSV